MDYRDSSDYSEMLDKARTGDEDAKAKILEVVRQKYAGNQEGLNQAAMGDVEQGVDNKNLTSGFYPNNLVHQEQLADQSASAVVGGTTSPVGKGLPKIASMLESRAPTMGRAIAPASKAFGPEATIAKEALDNYLKTGGAINTPEFAKLQRIFNTADKFGK